MVFDTRFINNKLIDLFGQDVTIKKVSYTTDEDKDVTGESFSNTISTKAWIMAMGGYRQVWEIEGYRIEGDYSGCFKSTVDINTEDIVVLNDGTECVVNEIIKHYEGNHVAYLEVIMNKMSTGE